MAWTYEQDFETLTNGNLAGQDNWSYIAGAHWQVQDTVSYTGDKAIALSLSATSPETKRSSSPTDGTWYFAFRIEGTLNSGQIRVGGLSPKYRMGIDQTNGVRIYSGSAWTTVEATIESDKWYVVEWEMGSQQRSRVFSNGAWGSWTSLTNHEGGSNSDFYLVEFTGSGTLYIDSISPTEPEQPGIPVTVLTESITVTDTLLKTTARKLSETLTNTASFVSSVAKGLTLTEIVNTVATLRKQTTRVLSESASGSGSVQQTIAESGDDGLISHLGNGDITITNNASSIDIDEQADENQDGFFRFQNINIPRGATITSATLTFTAYANGGSTGFATDPILTVVGNDVDDAAQPTPVVGGPSTLSPTVTSASVDTPVDTWTAETEYVSSDIKTVVQEIVDRTGWASGNALMFIVQSFATGGPGALRQVYAYDSNPAKTVVLDITYTATIGGLTLTDTLAAKALSPKILTEAITLTDTLIRSTLRALTESISLTASSIAHPSRILSEATTLSDTLSKHASHLLSETLTATDTVIRSTARLFSETVSSTATVIKSTARILSESTTLSDTFSYLSGHAATLTETITTTASLTHAIIRSFAENITSTATFTGFKAIPVHLSEAVQITDSLIRQATKQLTETVSLTASLIRSTSRALTETLTASDTLTTIKSLTRTFSETATLADTVTKSITKALTETVAATDSLIRATVRSLTETITASDTLRSGIRYGRILTETVTAADSLVRRIVHILTERVGVSDLLQRFRNGLSAAWKNITRTTDAWLNATRSSDEWTDKTRDADTWDNRTRGD